MAKVTSGVAAMLRSMEKARKRRARALAMYEAGKTHKQIGAAMGFTESRAQAMVSQARAERE